MNSSVETLQGLTVMVTRPQEQAGNLAGLIEKNGGVAFLYPVINIDDTDDTEQRDQLLHRLPAFDIAIFISPTAVRKTFEIINALPSNVMVAAIGSSTVLALNNQGIKVSIAPEGHDSEALLQHAQLQPGLLAGKSVIIFRGQGGRELLGDTLVSRGASVVYAEVYKRMRNDSLPPLSAEELRAIDIIAVTSNEGLQNLYDLAGERVLLTETPLLVPGIRCQNLAEKLGFSQIFRAASATDRDCMLALQKWAATR